MARCASPKKSDGEWIVHQWLKKAVLLSFRLNDMKIISGAPGGAVWWDKVDSKFLGWDEAQFPRRRFPRRAGRDRAPFGLHRQRRGVDAQLRQCRRAGGRRHHDRHLGHSGLLRAGGRRIVISRAAPGLGGVLEPLQAAPTIIEDNCFIGARAEVAEGVIVGEGSVLSMGVYLSASTKIIDRATGEIFMGKVPPYSVVVSGRCRPSREWTYALLRRDRQAGG